MPKTISIRIVNSTEHRLVRHRAIASTRASIASHGKNLRPIVQEAFSRQPFGQTGTLTADVRSIFRLLLSLLAYLFALFSFSVLQFLVVGSGR